MQKRWVGLVAACVTSIASGAAAEAWYVLEHKPADQVIVADIDTIVRADGRARITITKVKADPDEVAGDLIQSFDLKWEADCQASRVRLTGWVMYDTELRVVDRSNGNGDWEEPVEGSLISKLHRIACTGVQDDVPLVRISRAQMLDRAAGMFEADRSPPPAS